MKIIKKLKNYWWSKKKLKDNIIEDEQLTYSQKKLGDHFDETVNAHHKLKDSLNKGKNLYEAKQKNI